MVTCISRETASPSKHGLGTTPTNTRPTAVVSLIKASPSVYTEAGFQGEEDYVGRLNSMLTCESSHPMAASL